MTVSIYSLFSVATAEAILATGLEVATSLGLVPTSWRAGDPTRASFKTVAEVLASREEVQAGYIKGGFRSTAEGDWATVNAREVYGVERVEATYATSTLTVDNSGGASYEDQAEGSITFRSSLSGKTFHNVSAVTILPLATGTVVEVIADESGSDSSAAVDEIDEVVTALPGVSVTSSTQAIGVDEQQDEALGEQCDATLGALSPNGPKDAYEYVVRNSDLTGSTEITRADADGDSATGDVTVYVAGSSGPVTGAAVSAAQAAVDIWAEPITPTALVVNSTGQAIDYTMTVSGTDIPAGYAAAIESRVSSLLATVDIGGVVARSAIIAAAQSYLEEAGATDVDVVLTVPAASVSLATGYVPTPGTASITEV